MFNSNSSSQHNIQQNVFYKKWDHGNVSRQFRVVVEYIGLAEKVKGGYSIFFPDFPGFASAGHSLDEARKNAKDGLVGHIELMVEDSETLPKESSLDKIMKLREAKGCIPIFVSIIAPSGKAQ